MTRYFICYQPSMPLHALTTSHLVEIKHILQFLKGTITFGLQFLLGPLRFIAYCDVNWAGHLNDQKSTNRYYVCFGRNLVSWCAKKQSTVVRSSTRAKYHCLAHIAVEISWLHTLLCDLCIFLWHIPLIWYDNISVISFTSNPVSHACTKHIWGLLSLISSVKRLSGLILPSACPFKRSNCRCLLYGHFSSLL